MPILSMVDQKQLKVDSIISPVAEMLESHKLSITPARPPINNPSRYNTNSTFASGMAPHGLYPLDTKPDVASNVMHTYPPPQMVQYKDQQPVQGNGFINYAATNTTSHLNQTYPGLQEPPKPCSGYSTRLQIPSQPYHGGSLQSSIGQYGISTVSAIQQQQTVYTDSPVDTTAFPSYYTHESQDMTNSMPNIGPEDADSMQYAQQDTFPVMPYGTTQHNYEYMGQ